MGQTLFEKVWEAHAIRELPNGQTQLLIGTHLIHEVTSPQAFAMLRELGLSVPYPRRTQRSITLFRLIDVRNRFQIRWQTR
jgi:3-isopropylmalate/(R)-2-methylmalate dehydratase large subunit